MIRGKITNEINKKAVEIIGREITQEELRLVPYIHYKLVNGGKLERGQISKEERFIIDKWVEEGLIKFFMYEIEITKKYWEFINAMMWLGYVEDENKLEEK